MARWCSDLGGLFFKYSAQLFEARASLRGLGVAAGGDADGERGKGDAVMIVDLQRRIIAVGPFPAAVLALHGPHHVEHFAGHVAELARRLCVVESQAGPDDDRPEALRFRWPLLLPAHPAVIFVEAANLARVRQDRGQRRSRGHVEQIGVASGTLLGFLPVQRRAIQILRRLFRRKLGRQRFVRGDFRQAFLNVAQGDRLLRGDEFGREYAKHY